MEIEMRVSSGRVLCISCQRLALLIHRARLAEIALPAHLDHLLLGQRANKAQGGPASRVQLAHVLEGHRREAGDALAGPAMGAGALAGVPVTSVKEPTGRRLVLDAMIAAARRVRDEVGPVKRVRDVLLQTSVALQRDRATQTRTNVLRKRPNHAAV